MSQLSLIDVPTVAEVAYYGTDFCNVKIGKTNNRRRRGGELKIAMLLTFDGGEAAERRHQRMWDRYRIGTSEWFRPGDDLLLWLATQLLGRERSQESKVLQALVRGVKGRAVA